MYRLQSALPLLISVSHTALKRGHILQCEMNDNFPAITLHFTALSAETCSATMCAAGWKSRECAFNAPVVVFKGKKSSIFMFVCHSFSITLSEPNGHLSALSHNWPAQL